MENKIKKLIKFLAKYFYSVLSFLYLFTFGMFSAKNQLLVEKIFKLFNSELFRIVRIRIAKVDLSEAVSQDTCIQLFETMPENGNVSIIELVTICKLIRQFNPRALFEIGTFNGRTTLNMAANSIQEAIVYTLDLPRVGALNAKLSAEYLETVFIDKKMHHLKYLNTNYEKKIVQLYGDSAVFDFAPFFNKIDFVFIDGSHSYGYVLSDSMNALKLLRNGKGIIMWHDYGGGWTGVTKALNSLYLNDDKFRNIKYIEGTNLAYLIVG